MLNTDWWMKLIFLWKEPDSNPFQICPSTLLCITHCLLLRHAEVLLASLFKNKTQVIPKTHFSSTSVFFPGHIHIVDFCLNTKIRRRPPMASWVKKGETISNNCILVCQEYFLSFFSKFSLFYFSFIFTFDSPFVFTIIIFNPRSRLCPLIWEEKHQLVASLMRPTMDQGPFGGQVDAPKPK